MIKIIPYERQYAEEAVAMWRKAKERALGRKDIHSFADHVYFMTEVLAKDHDIFLALDEPKDRVCGLLALKATELSQLYLHVDYQQQGLGSRFMALAKERSPELLELYTYESNTGARQFYEKHGFKDIARGNDNEDSMPDIRYRWRSAKA